jgi:hypothetical protein
MLQRAQYGESKGSEDVEELMQIGQVCKARQRKVRGSVILIFDVSAAHRPGNGLGDIGRPSKFESAAGHR